MKDILQSSRDYSKCLKVIHSCTNILQLNYAFNMVSNYGKMYRYSSLWTQLDTLCSNRFLLLLDDLEYKERLEEIE